MIDFYDDLQMRKINFALLLVCIFISMISLLITILRPGNLFAQPIFTQEKMIVEDICAFGFRSLTEKKPYRELYTKEAYQILQDTHFDVFQFGDIKEIGPARISDTDNQKRCSIAIKDNQGTRAFVIQLVAVDSAFGHAIKDIEEVELKLENMNQEVK